MQKVYEKKSFNLKALDIDTTTKRVKIAFAEVDSVDLDNDVFLPTSWDKTIRERGPQGANLMYHLVDHEAKIKSSLGLFSEVGKEGIYIYGISTYKNTALWRDTVWPMYESGDIKQHSAGFSTVRSQKNKAGVREIIEVIGLEGSSVIWGAQPNTPTLNVSKSLIENHDEIELGIKRFDSLISAIKCGKFEEDQGLLQLEIKQLQQFAIDLSQITTQPEDASTAPVDEKQAKELIAEIKSFTQQQFHNGN